MTPIVQGGEVVEPLHERVLGRVVAESIKIPGSDEVLFEEGTLLDEAKVEELSIAML